jgi:glycine/D-amino acid oxidase-like deaminating enzyme
MFAEAKRFLPALATSRIDVVRKGLPTCTPDGTAILGPVPGMTGLHLLAGCQAFGVAGSGGLASLLVNAILTGQMPAQAQSFAVARWLERSWDEATARRAAESITQNYYGFTQSA